MLTDSLQKAISPEGTERHLITLLFFIDPLPRGNYDYNIGSEADVCRVEATKNSLRDMLTEVKVNGVSVEVIFKGPEYPSKAN